MWTCATPGLTALPAIQHITSMSRYPQRHEARTGVSRPAGAPRSLDAEAQTDLSSQLRSKVRVSCILAPEGIIWNRHKNKIVVIMRFDMHAIEEPGDKLKNFVLDISFAPAPPEASSPLSAPGVTTTTTTLDSDISHPSVWLKKTPFQNPLPKYIEGTPLSETQSRGFTVEPSVQAGAGGGSLGSVSRTSERLINHKWTFRSYPISDEQGHVTAAKWIWESNRNNPQVEDRGALHGAVVLHTAQPDALLLQCKVEGKLCNGWWWKKFKAKSSEPALWLAKLGNPSDDFEDWFNTLETRIEGMNTVGAARADVTASRGMILRELLSNEKW